MPAESQKPAEKLDPKAVVQLVISLTSGAVDEEKIRAVLGGCIAESQNEAAEIFDVSPATVRHTWGPNGFPKLEAARGKGSRVNIAEALIWLLKRNATNADARGADAMSKRKRSAETRDAEATADLRELKLRQASGEYVDRALVESEWQAFLAVAREDLMGIPRKMTPMFPQKHAAQYVAEADRLIRHALTGLSERPITDFLERMSNGED